MTEPLQGPPVLILGGDEIGLSVARSLGRRGVPVFALAVPSEPIRYSRYAKWIRFPDGYSDFEARCLDFLTGPRSDYLSGAVLLATTDEWVAMLAEHRDALQEKFRLDRSNPQAQRAMLDKMATYEAAKDAGIPMPRFWMLKSRADLAAVADELIYPLVVKPRLTHLFKRKFNNARHLFAHNLEDVERALDQVAAAGMDAFLVELIPGPDDLLCSYFTYLDDSGKAHFDFTKRIIRRYPKNMGGASYHVTDHVPGIKELALRLLRHVGLQGVANIEFKLDPRDGQYKLIECNGRFTGTNILVLRSGVNIAELVYHHVTGQQPKEIKGFRRGVRLLYPWRDVTAFKELHQLGDLDFGRWIASLMHPQTFPIWSLRDPGPATMPLIVKPARKLRGTWRRMRHSAASA